MNIRLEAEPRSDFGKGAARKLRRSGRIPVVLYGSGTELVHLSLPGHDLEQALRKPKVTLEIVQGSGTTLTKPRDVQRDPVRRTIEHVDLKPLEAATAAGASRLQVITHAVLPQLRGAFALGIGQVHCLRRFEPPHLCGHRGAISSAEIE